MKSKKREIPEGEYFFSGKIESDIFGGYEKTRFESQGAIHDTLSPYRQ